MLNRCWSLSKNSFILSILLILNGQYQAAWNVNHKFWEGTTVKIYKTQLPVLFNFLFYISFYISRYHFHNFLEFHSMSSEKNFRPKFSFFNKFTLSSELHPFNAQNLLNVTKNFCRFPLECPLKYFFFQKFIDKIL